MQGEQIREGIGSTCEGIRIVSRYKKSPRDARPGGTEEMSLEGAGFGGKGGHKVPPITG